MFIKRVLHGQKDNQAAPPSKPDCNTRDFISRFEADKSSWDAHTEDSPNPSSKVLELIGPQCNSSGLESPSNHFEADKSSCKTHIEESPNLSSKALELIGPQCNSSEMAPPSNLFEADTSSCEVHIEDSPDPSSKVLKLIGPQCNLDGLLSPSNHFEVDKSSCEAHIEDSLNLISQILEPIGTECNSSGLESPSNLFEAHKSSCKVHIEDSSNPSSKALELIGPQCNLNGLLSPSNHFEADKNCEALIEESPNPSSRVLEPIGPECNSSGMAPPSNLFETDKSSCKAHIEESLNPSSKALELIGPECNLNGLLSPSNHFEADKSSCELYIEDSSNSKSQVLEVLIRSKCNSSGMAPPSNLFEADKSSCKAHIEDSPNPSSKVLELIQPWRENKWQLEGRSVHLNKKKCEHFPRWFISAGQCWVDSITPVPSATREFCAAMERAKYLVEECSHGEWLLKAVELWNCTEHFVEVLLDLCWSAYIMHSVVKSIEWSEKWISNVEELLKSRSEQNDVAKLFHEDCNENDKKDLEVMVEEKLADRTLKVDCPEHQLAKLLRDRLKNRNLWRPPFLKRHRFYIYRDIIAPSQRSSKTGAHGAILKFPWVYGKEFAMKMRHPNEDGQKTFKREFDILDKYRSPYIVGVVGYWEAESWASWNPFIPTILCPFLLMENLEFDFKDLMDRCKRYNNVGTRIGEGCSELDTINLILPVAKALRFLHGRDVAHRDVKPQNIMCKNVNLPEDFDDNIVKLIDFGEAREDVSELEDGEGGRAGTPGYMDPTMWKQKQDHVLGYTLFMGDVFSFAMVFAELLTWKSPSEAFGVQLPRDAQIRLNAGERPPLPNGLQDYVRFIVESCWHVDHLKRPDFNAICSMLLHARILLLDKDFACELEDLFSYEDATGGERCISDQA